MKEGDNIEKFFRDRLGRDRDFEFQEEDWSKLESKLDIIEPTQPGSFASSTPLKAVVLTAGSVIIFLMGWFARSTFNVTGEETLQESAIEVIEDSESTDLETIPIQPVTESSAVEEKIIELDASTPVEAEKTEGLTETINFAEQVDPLDSNKKPVEIHSESSSVSERLDIAQANYGTKAEDDPVNLSNWLAPERKLFVDLTQPVSAHNIGIYGSTKVDNTDQQPLSIMDITEDVKD